MITITHLLEITIVITDVSVIDYNNWERLCVLLNELPTTLTWCESLASVRKPNFFQNCTATHSDR